MNKIDIHEICVLVEERFFTELTLYNEEYFKIDIKEDLTLTILLERLKNAKEKYKKEYSELYSSEFVVAFLEYYCKKSNFIAIYKNEKIIFTILYAFMKAIQENINSDPYSYMSIKNGAMRNLSHYKVYFKGDISVFSFENIFEDFNFRDYYYISPFLKNINIKIKSKEDKSIKKWI